MMTIPFRRNRSRGSRPYADALSVTDALRKLDADEAAARVPTFTPHGRPDAPTIPGPALRQPGRTLAGPVRPHAPQAMDVMRRVRDGLARGTAPLGDLVAAEHVPAGRLPQVSARRVTAAVARMSRLSYPAPGGDYSAVLADVDRITGTVTGPRAQSGRAA